MPQAIGYHRPDNTNYRTNQKGMKISVHWPAKSEQPYNQNLNVNNNVGQHEYRQVNPFSKYQPDETARPEMIWRKGHLLFNFVFQGNCFLIIACLATPGHSGPGGVTVLHAGSFERSR